MGGANCGSGCTDCPTCRGEVHPDSPVMQDMAFAMAIATGPQATDRFMGPMSVAQTVRDAVRARGGTREGDEHLKGFADAHARSMIAMEGAPSRLGFQTPWMDSGFSMDELGGGSPGGVLLDEAPGGILFDEKKEDEGTDKLPPYGPGVGPVAPPTPPKMGKLPNLPPPPAGGAGGNKNAVIKVKIRTKKLEGNPRCCVKSFLYPKEPIEQLQYDATEDLKNITFQWGFAAEAEYMDGTFKKEEVPGAAEEEAEATKVVKCLCECCMFLQMKWNVIRWKFLGEKTPGRESREENDSNWTEDCRKDKVDASKPVCYGREPATSDSNEQITDGGCKYEMRDFPLVSGPIPAEVQAYWFYRGLIIDTCRLAIRADKWFMYGFEATVNNKGEVGGPVAGEAGVGGKPGTKGFGMVGAEITSKQWKPLKTGKIIPASEGRTLFHPELEKMKRISKQK